MISDKYSYWIREIGIRSITNCSIRATNNLIRINSNQCGFTNVLPVKCIYKMKIFKNIIYRSEFNFGEVSFSFGVYKQWILRQSKYKHLSIIIIYKMGSLILRTICNELNQRRDFKSPWSCTKCHFVGCTKNQPMLAYIQYLHKLNELLASFHL